jgi:ABC-type multidrug transport system fused ATPase/permease subunit
VRHADRIVVVADGRIVEEGTHAELLARSGLYRRLHDAQFEDVGGRAAGADLAATL